QKMVSRDLDRDVYTYTGVSGSVIGSVANITELTNTSFNDAGIPLAHAPKFKDWLRGYRYELENGKMDDSTGVLGDMVNSGITVVGMPRHSELLNHSVISKRDAVVYVQTNRGVLHAVNYMNGSEIWGFIPPNIFQHKLKNMKFDREFWIDGNGLTRVRSNPMVLLDGMLIARDCENNNGVRTLMTGYLGRGGNGFYTMDITYMDSARKKPVFKWAIENARYDNSSPYNIADGVKRWGEAAKGGDISDHYDYKDLGLTIVPGVYFIPANRTNSDTVGVLPGGLGHMLGEDDTQGKAFYFFNPTNGSILRKIDSKSNSATGFDAPTDIKLGMGITPIIYQENSAKKAIGFYTADSEGNILMCDLDGIPQSEWKLKSIVQLRTLGEKTQPYEGAVENKPDKGLKMALTRKMILAKSRTGYKWLFGGTSDLDAPGSNAYDFRKLSNKEQFIFGFNVSNIIKSKEVDNGINTADAIGGEKMRYIPYYADEVPAEYGRYGQRYDYDDNIGITHGMDDFGWVIRLRPKFGVTDSEYLSADPYLMNNILYFATFIPNINKNSEEACSEIGVAKLYAIDPSTGRSVLENKSAITLDNIKISGISGNPSRNRLVLSVKELNSGAAQKGIASGNNFENPLDIAKGSLYEVDAPGGKVPDPAGEPKLNFEELVPHVQYWSETFR
ncbi:MAG: PilC/PilY family type IV pilus protein, partial [Synergistaceae bacterium]|nr:PilC/PilY family type IV pilus protein [Synergistaceae bacterium]